MITNWPYVLLTCPVGLLHSVNCYDECTLGTRRSTVTDFISSYLLACDASIIYIYICEAGRLLGYTRGCLSLIAVLFVNTWSH